MRVGESWVMPQESDEEALGAVPCISSRAANHSARPTPPMRMTAPNTSFTTVTHTLGSLFFFLLVSIAVSNVCFGKK